MEIKKIFEMRNMANIVLVVDMLRGFYDIGNLANPRMARIIPNVAKLLDRKTKEGWKIIFLADNHEKCDAELKLFPPHCLRGTEEAEIIKEFRQFAISSAIVIRKNTYSGFFGTLLGNKLAQEKPKIVVVVGVCTDICIFFTAYDLTRFGYNVVVPRDAVETYSAFEHDAEEINKVFLAQMKNILGIKIVEKQEVI